MPHSLFSSSARFAVGLAVWLVMSLIMRLGFISFVLLITMYALGECLSFVGCPGNGVIIVVSWCVTLGATSTYLTMCVRG